MTLTLDRPIAENTLVVKGGIRGSILTPGRRGIAPGQPSSGGPSGGHGHGKGGGGSGSGGGENVSELTLVALESFDHWGASTTMAGSEKAWTQTNGASLFTISSGNGRNGSNCLRLIAWNSCGAQYTLGQTLSTVVIGFALKMSAFPPGTARNLLVISGAGGTEIVIGMNSVGAIVAYRGTIAAGTLLGTSAAVFTIGAYQFVEVKVKLSNTVGQVTVRRNGNSILSLTGIDTTATATGTTNAIILGAGEVSAEGANIDIDDVYICSMVDDTKTQFYSDGYVKCVFPDGNGATNNFTPSAGTNFQNVDEAVLDSATTRNNTSTVNHIDLYTMGALGLTGKVRGVQVTIACARNGGSLGQIGNYRALSRPGSTIYNGTTKTINSYLFTRTVFPTNGDTTREWTVSEVDAAQFGLQFVAGGAAPGISVSQLVAEVLVKA